MDNHHRAQLGILTWFLLATSGVAVISRMSIKWSMSKRFNADDVFALLSLVFNVGAGVAVTIAGNHGLGAQIATLSDSGLRTVQKSIYVAGILYILTVACAKLSIVFLLRLLYIREPDQRVNLALAAVLILQAIGFTIAAMIPCGRLHVWAIGSGHCFDLEFFWRAVGISHIVMDVILIALPCYLVSGINMSLRKKMIVATCFAVRFIDIGVIATQLAYADRFKARDLTASVWPWYLIGQVAQTATIVSSCVPYLRQLLQAFPSGMFQSDEMRRRGLTYADKVHGFGEDGSQIYTLKAVDSEITGDASSDNNSSLIAKMDGQREHRVTTQICGDIRVRPHAGRVEDITVRSSTEIQIVADHQNGSSC